MIFVLDTQHVSQLQRESSRDSQLLESKMAAHATDIFHITIITSPAPTTGLLAPA